MTESKSSIYMFNDGSPAFRVLYNDLRDKYDIDIKKVDTKDSVIEWFSKVKPDKVTHLHFTNDDLIRDKEFLRKELEKVERLGFRNKIFLDYEGMAASVVSELVRKLPKEQEEQKVILDVIKEKGLENEIYPVKEFDEEKEPEFTTKTRKKKLFHL